VNITTVELENKTRIFILDQFFERELVRDLYELFDTVTTDVAAWSDSDVFKHHAGRLVYTGASPVLDKIRTAANDVGLRGKLSELLGHDIKFLSLDLWVDQPGYTIAPHYDPAFFEHAVQIYITNNPDYYAGPPLGTTIFQQQQQRVLFQLPYRTNFGYFFESPQQVYHGLAGSVPEGMQRNSVYLRFVRA
jgi:hypothetical protein